MHPTVKNEVSTYKIDYLSIFMDKIKSTFKNLFLTNAWINCLIEIIVKVNLFKNENYHHDSILVNIKGKNIPFSVMFGFGFFIILATNTSDLFYSTTSFQMSLNLDVLLNLMFDNVIDKRFMFYVFSQASNGDMNKQNASKKLWHQYLYYYLNDKLSVYSSILNDANTNITTSTLIFNFFELFSENHTFTVLISPLTALDTLNIEETDTDEIINKKIHDLASSIPTETYISRFCNSLNVRTNNQ